MWRTSSETGFVTIQLKLTPGSATKRTVMRQKQKNDDKIFKSISCHKKNNELYLTQPNLFKHGSKNVTQTFTRDAQDMLFQDLIVSGGTCFIAGDERNRCELTDALDFCFF